jgi:hypothetical protein
MCAFTLRPAVREGDHLASVILQAAIEPLPQP